ncbi:hypothetical protein ACSS6W_010047 [Trichoderma asperelloides]
MNKKQPADDTMHARSSSSSSSMWLMESNGKEKKQEIDKHMLPRGRVLGQGEMERSPSTD